MGYWESSGEVILDADAFFPNLEQIKEVLSREIAGQFEEEEVYFAEYIVDSEMLEFLGLDDRSPSDGSYHKYVATGPVSAPEDGIQVYTSFYNGFEVSGKGTRRDGSLITRVDGKVNFLLDETGTEGIALDDESF